MQAKRTTKHIITALISDHVCRNTIHEGREGSSMIKTVFVLMYSIDFVKVKRNRNGKLSACQRSKIRIVDNPGITEDRSARVWAIRFKVN